MLHKQGYILLHRCQLASKAICNHSRIFCLDCTYGILVLGVALLQMPWPVRAPLVLASFKCHLRLVSLKNHTLDSLVHVDVENNLLGFVFD